MGPIRRQCCGLGNSQGLPWINSNPPSLGYPFSVFNWESALYGHCARRAWVIHCARRAWVIHCVRRAWVRRVLRVILEISKPFMTSHSWYLIHHHHSSSSVISHHHSWYLIHHHQSSSVIISHHRSSSFMISPRLQVLQGSTSGARLGCVCCRLFRLLSKFDAVGHGAEMRCVAVCCSACCSVIILQVIEGSDIHAVHHAEIRCITVCCSVLQCVAVCCSVSQCVAVCCSVLQCVAVCCSVK